jgi:tetratricopeptide (TPR) repeat protein
LREILRIRVSALGERHPIVALTMVGGVAVALERQGRLEEAEAMAREGLATVQTRLGPRHRDVGTVLAVLASIVSRQGRHDEADRLYREAIDLKPAVNEGQSVLNGELRRVYGRFLTERRRFADAEAQLVESLNLLSRVYGSADHPNPMETKRALMALYQATGRPELVEKYRVPPGAYIPY